MSFRQSIIKTVAVAASCIPAGIASAAVIPVTAGNANPTVPNSFVNGFDAQPTTEPVAGETTDPVGSKPTLYYGSRTQEAGYIDFGADHIQVVITGVFSLLHQYGHNANNVPYQYAWSSDNTGTGFENRATAYTPAPNFGLFTYPSATSDQQWVQVYSNPVGVMPAARYLIVYYDVADTTGLSSSDRAEEFVFVGSAVPEPASLALLGLGGVMVLSRKRRGEAGDGGE